MPAAAAVFQLSLRTQLLPKTESNAWVSRSKCGDSIRFS
ncbi:MAG: hypothetical protein QOJ42_2294, partial [Acidobacteriaceae bacterium]|nr:hypothetical protein [Acidobacteriaceae bacterium]